MARFVQRESRRLPIAQALMPQPPAAISVHDLTRRFGDAVAVDRLSFDVPSGAICGVTLIRFAVASRA